MRKLLLLVIVFVQTLAAHGSVSRWWPVQKAPKQIVRTVWHEEFEASPGPNNITISGHLSPTHMMVESIAGLAAAAVNDGTCDEMIWMSVGNSRQANPSCTLWYDQALKQLAFKDNGILGSWDLVKRFRDKGVIKGYILYSYDTAPGEPFEKRARMDLSANVATVLASVYKGILIDERQEEQAKQLGLKCLADARGKNVKWCFDTYKDKLDRNMVLIVDPKVGHCRDYAIANRCMVIYGGDKTVREVLAWLNPLSIILGWNYLPENESTILTSEYGHLQTATNWIINLPILSALPECGDIKPKHKFDPAAINFNDTPDAVSFMMTDGDNLCWLVGDFCTDPLYWASPEQGKFPAGWTSCPVNMAQASPATLEYLFATQPKDTTFIEYGDGYHYPDYLGKYRDANAVLTAHARRTGQYMKNLGINVFGFICMDVDSAAAKNAYQIYAREMPGLAGMMAVQYAPYEGGHGKVYWVKNNNGIEIPVVTAKYALWANYNSPTGGTPAKVANMINADSEAARKNGQSYYSWTIVHAWSGFKKISDNNEIGENGEFLKPGNETGLIPIKWCIDRLDKKTKVVSPEELIWRIRMEHDPRQTKHVIEQMQK